MKNSQMRNRKQGGFTLIELMVVLAIMGMLVVFAITYFRGYTVKGKVKPTADALAIAITDVRLNAEGGGATPYASMTTAALANTVGNRATALTVTGTGNAATMTHQIGETGATITAAPATITTLGDSFTVTVNNVNDAACPSLASILNPQAEVIRVNGTVVKSIPAGTTYNGQTAKILCNPDDTNTFVFQVR